MGVTPIVGILPETKIAPENRPHGKGDSPFLGAALVLREGTFQISRHFLLNHDDDGRRIARCPFDESFFHLSQLLLKVSVILGFIMLSR